MKLEKILKLNSLMRHTFFESIHETYDIPSELKETHIKTLILIGSKEKQTMTEVSSDLGLEKGSFTPVASRLLDNGYIGKIRCTEDKRACYLDLTQKGEKFVRDITEELQKHVSKKLDSLTPEEKDIYTAAIDLVYSITKKICDGE